jgi:hypothetical protein
MCGEGTEASQGIRNARMASRIRPAIEFVPQARESWRRRGWRPSMIEGSNNCGATNSTVSYETNGLRRGGARDGGYLAIRLDHFFGLEVDVDHDEDGDTRGFTITARGYWEIIDLVNHLNFLAQELREITYERDGGP